MKTYQAIFIIICIVLASQTYGYLAYEKEPMKGNVIFPLTAVDVKLSEVSILMGRRQYRSESIKVAAEYILENLSSKEINFTVGFAVDSYAIVIGSDTKMPDDFKVLVNNRTVKTSTSKIMSKYFITDRQGKTIAEEREIPLIMWDISFKPKEKKIITTEYTMEWLLEPGGQYLELDLSRLYLWKGNIAKAYFRVALTEDLIDDIKAKDPSRWPRITIEPPKYKMKDHALEWFFKDLRQKKVYRIGVDVDYSKPGMIGD